MNYTLPKTNRYLFVCAVLSFFGCTDAHNNLPSPDIEDKNNLGTQTVIPTAIQISSEEFNDTDFSGTWKRRFLFNATKEVNLTINGVDTSALETRGDSYFDVISIEQITETSTLIKYCDSLPAKLIEINPENSIVINSTNDDSTKPSKNSHIAQYYKITDDHYRIDLYTNDELDGYFELEKHSSLLDFDFGMFSFFMTDKADLNASYDVCGKANLSTVTLTDALDDAITFNPISAHLNSYSVNAPYENSFVTLKISFVSAINKATYNVTQDVSGTQTPVLVEISSPEFNTSPGVDTTTIINGREGLVTIDSISDTSVRGNYDLILENNEVLTGDFSFDLNSRVRA